MAGKVYLGLLAGLGVAISSLGAWAEEPKEANRGNPEALFNRLDKNHDGVITSDEIPPGPPGMPERLKAWLQKADKNGDKKVTREEWKEAFKAGPPGMPWAGPERPRRGPDAPGPRPRPLDRPSAGPQRPQPPSKERPQLPDLKALFSMMDKNHDGSLSLDEFVDGMKELHRRMAEHFRVASAERPRPAGPGPGPGMGRGFGMGRPEMGGPPGPGWHPGPMGWPGQPWQMAQAYPGPWSPPGPPLWSPGPWHGPRSWGGGPPWWHQPQPWQPGPAAGPSDEHLRKLVAAMVRDELQKILKEKSEAAHSQGPDRAPKPERKK